VAGTVLLAKGWEWDRSIPRGDRDQILERIFRLPDWVDNQLGTDNLDVKRLEGHNELLRLRWGDHRVVFQILGPSTVIHRIGPRVNIYRDLGNLSLVRSADGLRSLEPERSPIDEAPSLVRPPVRKPVERPVQQNPLSPFVDDVLTQAGIPEPVIKAVRRVPKNVHLETALANMHLEHGALLLLLDMWERPSFYLERLDQGATLDVELARLEEEEAALRVSGDLSSSSLMSVADMAAFAALLDRPIEDWMVYLHPEQAWPVRLSIDGPVRVKGAAGTGKTVVALHRARRLAEHGAKRVLLTTFLSTLPDVWRGLFATFAPEVASKIDMRSVDKVVRQLYLESGGEFGPAGNDERLGALNRVIQAARRKTGGLAAGQLDDEIEIIIEGRALGSLDEYLALERSGRGSSLLGPAREEVWEIYERYRARLGRAGLIDFAAMRREALAALREGRVSLEYDAVIVDEAQDLTETSVRLLAELAGGFPRPNITVVGDGQQSIYAGGFSLRSVGIDVRGRSKPLTTNWRNTYAIWLAAQAFIAGESFDDLEDDELETRLDEDTPYPLRDGVEPRLFVLDDSYDEAAFVAALVADDVQRGVDPADCAVLHPTNKGVDAILRALRADGVPTQKLTDYKGVRSSGAKVGTFHRAKGIEFKRVYIAGLGKERWPILWKETDRESRDAERKRQVRAAFVAMTRARDDLQVVCAGEPSEPLARSRWAFRE
jgi:mRNA-degrading endonuclease RelE of RelBE toxin-antitoxin system